MKIEYKSNNFKIFLECILVLSKLQHRIFIIFSDILKGKVDVVVCDGFVGNIILKFAESIMGVLTKSIKRNLGSNLFVSQASDKLMIKTFVFSWYTILTSICWPRIKI